MSAGKSGVILENIVVVIIPQFEIGLVEDLVVFDMSKQFQIVVAVKALRDFLPVQIGHFAFQLISYRVGQPINIRIVRIKCGPV